MIILNEKEYAERCLRENSFGNDVKNLYSTLTILAKYYYFVHNYRKKKIKTCLLDFLKQAYPRYEIDDYDWIEYLDKISGKAGKVALYEIDGVKITKTELQIIESLKDKVLERLMFTMLCLAKYYNEKNPTNNGWVNTDSKDIYKLARISCTSKDREIKIGELYRKGLLDFSKRIDNTNCRVTFIEENSDSYELFISDFRELGYEYRAYKGQSFIHCADCGILTRNNKAGTKRYCKSCAAYTPQITKLITCADCGKVVEVDSKDNQTNRCIDCYTQYRKKYKAEKEKERRQKLKSDV